jgi:hypothetical protein
MIFHRCSSSSQSSSGNTSKATQLQLPRHANLRLPILCSSSRKPIVSYLQHRMQGSGRILLSTTRSTALRLTRAFAIQRRHPPPPTLLFTPATALQRRGYRPSAVVLKDDDKKHKPGGKEVEKQSSADETEKRTVEEQDAKAVDKESGTETKSGEEEGAKKPKEKGQRSAEEAVRPAIISRNQALSLVANSGNKSRLIVANHDHPETYPQCIALAMSGRPILPGFYSTLPRNYPLR